MNTRTKLSLAAVTAISSFCAFAGPASAQAFYLQEQSARAAGRAFSGEAADTGPSSLWWNPASIAGIKGVQADISASLILPDGEAMDRRSVVLSTGVGPANIDFLGPIALRVHGLDQDPYKADLEAFYGQAPGEPEAQGLDEFHLDTASRGNPEPATSGHETSQGICDRSSQPGDIGQDHHPVILQPKS